MLFECVKLTHEIGKFKKKHRKTQQNDSKYTTIIFKNKFVRTRTTVHNDKAVVMIEREFKNENLVGVIATVFSDVC